MSRIAHIDDFPDEMWEEVNVMLEEIRSILVGHEEIIAFTALQASLYNFIHYTVPREEREKCLQGVLDACRMSFKKLDAKQEMDLSES